MPDPDRLQSLWKTQAEEPFVMSLADLRARAEQLQSRIRLRNFIEYAAGAVVVGAFTWTAVVASGVVAQIGAALVALGAVYVCWRLHVLARAANRAEFAATASCADFHRAELVRQRDALDGVWRWYLGPLVPGLVVFWIGVGFAPSVGLPVAGRIAIAAIGLGIGAAVFLAIGHANAKAAKALQAEIDALDRARQAR
jgi:hypothetical protein